MTQLRRFGSLVASPVIAAMLILGLIAAGPMFSSPASAESTQGGTISCAAPVTGAPTGPATVSVKWTHYGRVLVVGPRDIRHHSLGAFERRQQRELERRRDDLEQRGQRRKHQRKQRWRFDELEQRGRRD